MWKRRGFLYLAVLVISSLVACGGRSDDTNARPGSTRWVEDDVQLYRWVRSGVCREFMRKANFSEMNLENTDSRNQVKRIECQEVYAKYLPIELLPLDPKPSK